MRSLLLATTFGAAQSLAVTNKSKKPAVQALMESATTMLKNGATPEVVTFAQYTLDEVTGTVLPAIIAESENDQAFILSLYARFAVITAELKQGNENIHNLNAEEMILSTDHKDCREAEHLQCYGDGCEGNPNKDCSAESTSKPIDECGALHAANHHDDQDGEAGRWGRLRDGEASRCVHECRALHDDNHPDDQSRCIDECRWTVSNYREGKRPCEKTLYTMWEAWVTAEEDLKVFHDHIEGAFCPPEANGTTKTFRVSAAEWMHDYMIKKGVVDQKLIDYDSKALCCEVAHGVLEDNTYNCDLQQHDLEEKACEHASKIHAVLNTYYRDHSQALSAYQCAEEEVRQLESDRKKEFVTLEVVRCLLDRIEEQNGVPCDESTGGVTDAVATCEERHDADLCGECNNPIFPYQTASGGHFCYNMPHLAANNAGRDGFDSDSNYCESWCTTDPEATAANDGCDGCCGDVTPRLCTSYDFDVRKLCIDYPPPPEHPPFCADRHHVEGETPCRPEPIPTPCVDNHNFRWEHYDGLFPVPEPPFSSTNPGCNAQAPCTACAQPDTPSPIEIDTCPGYTVDGCNSDGNVLTFIRSVNGLADVRCCATEGVGDVTCKTQGFEAVGDMSPVDFTFTTEDGDAHTQCYFEKTYQEALQICHDAGMRICTIAELNTEDCCGTGCSRNHHATWVDAVQGQTAATYHTEGQHVENRAQEEAKVALDSAIASRQIADLQAAIQRATEAELPEEEGLLQQAKAALAEEEALQQQLD